MLELSLARLQAWMQAVVVHPGGVDEAVAEDQALVPAGRLHEVIRPSRTLTPAERLGVYHDMYPLRMVEALQSDYPALQHFLGEEAFARLVHGYVQEHPSRSFTLNDLGRHLPEHVLQAPGLKRRAFCGDLARLEWAVSETFNAPQTEPLSPAAVAAVPEADWERARLEPIAALRLLTLDHNANAWLQSWRDEAHDHPRPRRQASWVAVYRRDYAVYRLELSRAAHRLLAELVAGARLGPAVAAALKGRGAPGEDQLFRWFREWMAGGLFRSVSTAA